MVNLSKTKERKKILSLKKNRMETGCKLFSVQQQLIKYGNEGLDGIINDSKE